MRQSVPVQKKVRLSAHDRPPIRRRALTSQKEAAATAGAAAAEGEAGGGRPAGAVAKGAHSDLH